MSKCFTDTEVWKKCWFMKLAPAEKAFWFFLKDQCDNVGVWDVNFELATFHIGCEIDWKAFVDKVNGNIEILNDDKWWFPDFCKFQYGNLNENSKPHKSYLALLEKHGLLEKLRVWYTLMDKDKDNDKEKDKDKDKKEYAPFVHMTEAECGKLVDKYGKAQTAKLIDKLSNAKGAKGYKYKNDYRAILTWVVDACKVVSTGPGLVKTKHRCIKCKGLLVDLGGGEYGCPPCSKTFKMNDGKLKDTS